MKRQPRSPAPLQGVSARLYLALPRHALHLHAHNNHSATPSCRGRQCLANLTRTNTPHTYLPPAVDTSSPPHPVLPQEGKGEGVQDKLLGSPQEAKPKPKRRRGGATVRWEFWSLPPRVGRMGEGSTLSATRRTPCTTRRTECRARSSKDLLCFAFLPLCIAGSGDDPEERVRHSVVAAPWGAAANVHVHPSMWVKIGNTKQI